MTGCGWGFPFDFPAFFGTDEPWSRGTGPRRGFFRAGEVRLAILSLLAEEPGHGYDLMKRMEERSGGLYRASAGTVYPVLQQLEDEGLVVVSEEESRKVYRITDAGREELAREGDAVRDIWRRAGRWREWGGRMGPDTVEVALSFGRLAKAAFATASTGSRATGDRVVEVLEEARRTIEGLDADR